MTQRIHGDTGIWENSPAALLCFRLVTLQMRIKCAAHEVQKRRLRGIAGDPLPPLVGGPRLVREPRQDVGIVRVTIIPRVGRYLHFAVEAGCLAEPRIDAIATDRGHRTDGDERLPGFPAEFP